MKDPGRTAGGPSVAMETFTLFILLPSKEVSSLRNLESGVTVREIRCKLEMMAGLPAQMYRLTGTDEKVFHEEQDLVPGKNVWDGFLLRIQLLGSWEPIYDAVMQDNVTWILEQGTVLVKEYQFGGEDDDDDDDDEVGREREEENARRVIAERGAVVLFMACWRGKDKLCRALLDAGINPNGRTPFRRSPIFACVAQDNDRILETMINRGAKLSVKDCFGDTAVDVAKRNFARQCVSTIRSLQLMNRNRSSPRTMSPASSRPDTPKSTDGHWRIDSARTPPRIRSGSGRGKPKRISMTENTALVNGVSSPDTKMAGKENEQGGVHVTPSVKHRQVQMTYRGVSSVTQNNSPRPSTISSSASPRVAGDFRDKVQQRASSGVQFRLAIPHAASPSSHKVKHVVTWDCPLSEAEFLSVNQSKLANLSPAQRAAAESNCSYSYSGHGTTSSRLSPVPASSTCKGGISVPSPTSSPRTSVAVDDQDTSIDARSVESAPQMTTSRGVAREAFVSRIASARPSTSRARQRLEASKKKSESLTAAKRRIQLSEKLKLDAKKRETFEQWLKRKRVQERTDESRHSTENSSSEDDGDETSTAFRDWLKEVKDRPLHRPNPKSAASLHHRKTRAIHGLIEIGDTTPPEHRVVSEADASSYMHSHRDWLRKRKGRGKEGKMIEDDQNLDPKAARKVLENKRLELLAMAVSFDEWMTHVEEKKTLEKVIQKADKNQLNEQFAREKSTHKNGQPMPFQQWKQKIESQEGKQKLKDARIRQQQRADEEMRGFYRNSASVPHEAWLKKKMQQNQLQQQQHLNRDNQQQRRPVSATDGSGSSSSRSFNAWVNKKQGQEMRHLNSGIRREKQLLMQLREKKHVTISC